MLKIGLDLGYNAVKLVTPQQTLFPSVVGTPDTARFKLIGPDNILIGVPGGEEYLVGREAVEQSRMSMRREDRDWIESTEFYVLFLTALSHLPEGEPVRLVTGLPVAFIGDADKLKDILVGEHIFSKNGYSRKTFVECRVIPQPFGTVLSEVLNDNGEIANAEMAQGMVGVIDVGGKTTNILTVNRTSEVPRMTTSVNIGGWDVVRAIRRELEQKFPELDLRDAQVSEILSSKRIKYFGQMHDLTELIADVADPFARSIISESSQLWGAGAALDMVLITGGGAHLVGSALCANYRLAKVVDNPVFANAIGYYRLALRLNQGA